MRRQQFPQTQEQQLLPLCPQTVPVATSSTQQAQVTGAALESPAQAETNSSRALPARAHSQQH